MCISLAKGELISTSKTNFPTLANGMYTTIIPASTNPATTNGIVKLNAGQLFKSVSIPTGYSVGNYNWLTMDEWAVSLDGTNFFSANYNYQYAFLSDVPIIVAGPAYIRYVHQVSKSPAVVTFGIYGINPAPQINY
jgi:hypothetical protein